MRCWPRALATRAYRALNRVCLGQARRVRFKSRGRGLSSVENKRNETGLRFVLEQPAAGNVGYLRLPRRPVAGPHRLGGPGGDLRPAPSHQIRPAPGAPGEQFPCRGSRLSGPALFRAAGARLSCRITSPNTWWAATRLGWTWDPPRLPSFPVRARHAWRCVSAELAPDAQAIRQLQRQMDRQRRANNPDNYDEKGRIKSAARRA
jgi:hypothetical protein